MIAEVRPASNQLWWRLVDSPLLGHAAASLLTTWADHRTGVDAALILHTFDPHISVVMNMEPPALWLTVTRPRIRP